MRNPPHRLISALALATALVSASGALTPSEGAAAPKVRSLGGGAWSWFADPRAVHYEGAHNRTYVSWIDRLGGVRVASYDHATRVRTTIVLHWNLGVDDHNNPALHVLPDGRVMVFYSRHGGSDMYYRV